MMRAYILDKALYELAYELNNRPTWVHIPLTGVLQLRPRSGQSAAENPPVASPQ
jgi:predicted trehalose synthase